MVKLMAVMNELSGYKHTNGRLDSSNFNGTAFDAGISEERNDLICEAGYQWGNGAYSGQKYPESERDKLRCLCQQAGTHNTRLLPAGDGDLIAHCTGRKEIEGGNNQPLTAEVCEILGIDPEAANEGILFGLATPNKQFEIAAQPEPVAGDYTYLDLLNLRAWMLFEINAEGKKELAGGWKHPNGTNVSTYKQHEKRANTTFLTHTKRETLITYPEAFQVQQAHPDRILLPAIVQGLSGLTDWFRAIDQDNHSHDPQNRPVMDEIKADIEALGCLLYTSPSPRD